MDRTRVDKEAGGFVDYSGPCPRCTEPDQTGPFCSRCTFDLRHGVVKAGTEGPCGYCGTVGPLTAEHLFGDWARRAYPKKEKRFHQLERPTKLNFHNRHQLEGVRKPQKTAERYGETASYVCADCNNGWMSGVVKAAQPFLARLADGEVVDLDGPARAVLARWAAMSAVTMTHFARGEFTISQHERDIIRNGAAPPACVVWIGLLKDTKGAGMTRCMPMAIPLGVMDGFARGQLSYLCIERLVVITFSTVGELVMSLWKYHAFDPPSLGDRIGLKSIWPSPSLYPMRTDLTIQEVDSLFP